MIKLTGVKSAAFGRPANEVSGVERIVIQNY